jgi:hypothetical protein
MNAPHKRLTVVGLACVSLLSASALAGGAGPVAQPTWPTFAADQTCTPQIANGTPKLGRQANTAVSAQMKAIFDADQADREGTIDWAKVVPRDQARQVAVLKLLQGGRVATSQELVGAAFVFQHGNCSNHFLLAHTLAGEAMKRGDRQSDTKFIFAATLDRYLLNTGKLQKYATQYMGDQNGCNMKLSATDPATTDAERLALELPTLAEAEAAAPELNQPNCPK